eukprot:CAMPEP_0183449906 /NCGR_PEP_ID=MMETSP0370-20130417/111140_1 /TAXON_ID=268820 /ORGANISM="Peridinium aciculiferum, Strain PAER-2" /LENGTH=583 /DNA_ID=CAMNT_0025641027 /DNA_START=1 /DNA_END=1752 /DNA_ORIENTATION=+
MTVSPTHEGERGVVASVAKWFGLVNNAFCTTCTSECPAYGDSARSLPMAYQEMAQSEEDPLKTTEQPTLRLSPDAEPAKPVCSCFRWLGCCCCLLLLLVLAAYGGLLYYLSGLAISKFVTLEEPVVRAFTKEGLDMGNITYNIWWPGCEYVHNLSDFSAGNCTRPCYSPDLMEDMHFYNGAHPGALVSFPSRANAGIERIKLTGWWLPAGKLITTTTTTVTSTTSTTSTSKTTTATTTTATTTTVTTTRTKTIQKAVLAANGTNGTNGTKVADDEASDKKDKSGRRLTGDANATAGGANATAGGANATAAGGAGGKSAKELRPRIVIQHGFRTDSNDFRVMLVAYMLRDLGFDVLVNNLRDHGYSESSKNHIYEWGHAYPFDVLGAWDYARTDPDKIMGGPVPKEKVGLLGFSMGAFIVLDAFGLDGDVPAVWVDSPPFTPKVVFAHGAEKELVKMGLPASILPLVLDPVWARTEAAAMTKDVDLNKHLPSKELPKGPDTERPIYVTSNKDDDTVPYSEQETLMTLLASYPKKYATTTWFTEGTCAGDAHCVGHLKEFDVYKARLCKFWRGVFKLNDKDCLVP